MDNFELDNWLTGGQYHKVEIEMKCSCGWSWKVQGYSEYGQIYLQDEDKDSICPNCGQICE